jgi:UDP-GlcNAc:undecaprenyl-phosphate GlcNAc-1-phosphate transferase
MGDAGALFLGVLLATLTVRFQPNAQTQVASYLIPIFLLALPILDTTVAVTSRIKRGLSPFQGGQDHLSHRLIRAGYSRRGAAFSLWGLSALFGGVAILISQVGGVTEYYLAAVAVSIWIILFVLFFKAKDA